MGSASAQRATAKPDAQVDLTPEVVPALDCLRIAVTTYDAHEKLTYANQHFDYLFRAMPPRAQLLGLRYDEIVRLEVEAGEIAPSALESGADPFVASRRSQLTAGDHRPIDVHLVDGRIIEIKPRPIKSGGWIALWSDVTAARHAIWRLENAIDMAADAFAFFDRHDALVMCNMEFAHIYGRSVEEMRGCAFDTLITGLVRQGRINTGGEDDKWIARRLDLHHTPAGAMTVETFDGTAYLVRDRETRDGGRVSVLTDITDERRTERALAEQSSTLSNTREALARSKDEAARQSRYLADLTQRMDAAAAEADTSNKTMLRTMSHELKTPLNAIIGFSDLLQQFADGFGPEQVKEYAGLIHSGGHNLLRLINQILDLTKIAGGKFELARSRVDAGGALWSAGEQWRERAAAKEITIDSELCASGQVVDADEGALGQIINNLLSNAVTYTPRGGRVTLKASSDGGFVTIVVADNGPGVAKADLARILLPFEQAHNGSAEQSGGGGLGLTLTKTLVELHGGRLEIASSDAGFTATVRLPRVE